MTRNLDPTVLAGHIDSARRSRARINAVAHQAIARLRHLGANADDLAAELAHIRDDIVADELTRSPNPDPYAEQF